ncbi:hypothetical protein, partial [Enterobacter cloacae complex sp. P1B]|uniref:hypothetical protein n=1 Tax=Enterobacter cloacae complex sp. P1B TaxID=2779593 RepID=UPI001D0BF08B
SRYTARRFTIMNKASFYYKFFIVRVFMYLGLFALILCIKDDMPTVLPQMKKAYYGWFIIMGSIMLWDVLLFTNAMSSEKFKMQLKEKFVGTSLLTKLKYSILISSPIIGTISLVHGVVISLY